MTTSHHETPQTAMKKNVNAELLYCPLPLPIPLDVFPLLPPPVFIYFLPFKSVLCGVETTPYMHLQGRLRELGSTAKITAEIILFFFPRVKSNISPTDRFPSEKCVLIPVARGNKYSFTEGKQAHSLQLKP